MSNKPKNYIVGISVDAMSEEHAKRKVAEKYSIEEPLQVLDVTMSNENKEPMSAEEQMMSDLTLNVITQEFTTCSIKAVRLANRIIEWHNCNLQ